jgi:hypothetical protein
MLKYDTILKKGSFMKKSFLVLMMVVLIGCSNTPYIEEDSAYIVFRTPAFKYADMGFMYKNANEVKLQIYSNAQSIMSLRVTKDSVCLSALECMGSNSFNAKVLNRYYPPMILENILRAKEIIGGKNLLKTKQGFTQHIKSKYYDINYKVITKKVLFRDKINQIKIQIIIQ